MCVCVCNMIVLLRPQERKAHGLLDSHVVDEKGEKAPITATESPSEVGPRVLTALQEEPPWDSLASCQWKIGVTRKTSMNLETSRREGWGEY